jgi:hypothetical protein
MIKFINKDTKRAHFTSRDEKRYSDEIKYLKVCGDYDITMR